MKSQSVLETTNQVRYQIGVSGTVVDQLDVACLHGAHTLAGGDAHTAARIPVVDYLAKGFGPMNCAMAALPRRLDNCDWAAKCMNWLFKKLA